MLYEHESHEFCCWKIHGYSTLVKLHPETGVYAHVLRDYMLMMSICRCIDTGACLNPVTAGVIHSFFLKGSPPLTFTVSTDFPLLRQDPIEIDAPQPILNHPIQRQHFPKNSVAAEPGIRINKIFFGPI